MSRVSDKPELQPDLGDNIIRTYDGEYDLNHKGLGYELFESLKKYSLTDSIAQIEASTGNTDTFKSLFRRCIQVATELKRRGVTPDDIITPCTTNHLDSAVIFLAPLFMGAKVASLDPYMDVRDIKSLLYLVRAKFIFVCHDVEDKIGKIIEELNIDTEIVVFGDTTKNTSFKEFLQPLSEEEELAFVPWEPLNKDDTSLIVFSSGSTGIPKGICYSHNAFICRMISTVKQMTVEGRLIVYSTLVWGSSILSILHTVIQGYPRLVCSIFEAAKTWKYIEKYQPMGIFLAPHDCVSLIRYGNPDGIDSSCIKRFSIIGGGLSTGSRQELKKLFPNALVYSPYGQTESAGEICGLPKEKLHIFNEKPNTVGWPVRGLWYKVVDPVTEKICGPNEKGEIRIKNRFQMSGYYKMDSSDAWDEDGYLKTGDVGYYDEDYCFFVEERIKEVLRYKMHAIPPSLLENILHEHPAVYIAVVIGIPSDEGDQPMALIVKNDSMDVTGKELEDFLATRVDERKKLRAGVKFIEESEIPKTPSGKVRRYLLRHKVLEDIKSRELKY